MPDKAIIADTSCLIILSKINELDLLQKLYRQIETTVEVAEEFGEVLPEWIGIKTIVNKKIQLLLALQLDRGEASALALALETPNSLIILDDFKARKIAEQLSLSYTGTLGVIVKAKKEGIIHSVKPLLARIKQTNFRISPQLEQAVWKAAGEHE